MTLLDTAKELLFKIKSLGYEAYIVGGTPRDILMKIEPEDIDITTNCPVDILDKNFTTHDIGKSRDFGIVVIVYEGERFEVAQFRTESDYDGVRPGKVEMVGSIEADLKRRDFTINALAMDEYGVVHDFIGSSYDIEYKLIRAVGNPVERFTEDYVRMIRAARFASMDGFVIEAETEKAIKDMAPLVRLITPERIRLELIKAAKKPGPQFAKFILLLDKLRLLEQILPDISVLKELKHDETHHPEGPTVFHHVIKCLEISGDMPYISKLAILFHDVGKFHSADYTVRPGKVRYHRHEEAGVEPVLNILKDLKFSEYEINHILYAVKHHMQFHDILKMKPSKIARLISQPEFITLRDVGWADEYSRGETFMHYGEFELKVKRMEEIRVKWEDRIVNNSINLVDGNLILSLLNIKPGPLVGKIKREIEEHIIDNSLEPTDELIKDLILKYKE